MADEMRIEYMALSDLLRTERNPKKHDLPSLRASMLRWGFTQPLAIDERTGKLVEGHGRIEVLQEMKKAGGKPPLHAAHTLFGTGTMVAMDAKPNLWMLLGAPIGWATVWPILHALRPNPFPGSASLPASCLRPLLRARWIEQRKAADQAK